MQYLVVFFAASANNLAMELSESTSEVLEKARQFVEEKSDDSEAAEKIIEAAEDVCGKKIPADAPQVYFDAFYAILSVLTERIALDSFEFGSCLYMMDLGIWPWTQQETPPILLPRKQDGTPPEFGYMSCDFMRKVVLPRMSKLPPSEMGCQRARNEFEEVVESVVSDGLDLFAYFSVW
jgi:hypothetical protein